MTATAVITATTATTATSATAGPAAVAAPGAATARHQAVPAAGPAWHTVQAGKLSSSAFLFEVATAGADAAWAVGNQTVGGVTSGVILHWDGTAWRRQPTPGVPATGVWHAVTAASAHDVWAYGWSQTRETLAHYDGRSWTAVALPELPPEQIYGFAKIAAVPGRLWVVNDTSIATYSGGTWQRTALGSGVFITSIEAHSATDAWAVGESGDVPGGRSVALHWNGHAWKDVSPAGSKLILSDVYRESARSVWAAAVTQADEDNPPQTRVLHWNGRTWKDVTGPLTGLVSGEISGDGRGTVWVSGDPAGFEGPAVYWRHRGGVWTSAVGDTVPGGVTQSYTVQDLAPIGRTGRFWSVGSYELLVGEATSATYELIQRSPR
ncbi:hypothetical protein OG552_01885 [Streptomyces sp. NBC_01476]|uniref:hypothetical protein n=1 Tax=Streptomyces sp. NBC_01476 TaxID=2903881 RepID=UPI002E3628C1|nr:hypothetical protein [Streptomyces sp. NBC_01476]